MARFPVIFFFKSWLALSLTMIMSNRPFPVSIFYMGFGTTLDLITLAHFLGHFMWISLSVSFKNNNAFVPISVVCNFFLGLPSLRALRLHLFIYFQFLFTLFGVRDRNPEFYKCALPLNSPPPIISNANSIYFYTHLFCFV